MTLIPGLESVPSQYGSKRFFHYTSVQHLESIERRGLIIPTESNIGSPTPDMPPFGEHVGPDVVWLMDEEDPFAHDHGLAGSFHNKRAVRIEVDVPAILWLAWEPAMRMNPVWRGAFMHSGGGSPAYHHWYVWPAPIKRGRWKSISFITDRRGAKDQEIKDREVRDPRDP